MGLESGRKKRLYFIFFPLHQYIHYKCRTTFRIIYIYIYRTTNNIINVYIYNACILDLRKSFRLPWRYGADGVRWKLQKLNICIPIYVCVSPYIRAHYNIIIFNIVYEYKRADYGAEPADERTGERNGPTDDGFLEGRLFFKRLVIL